MSNKFLLFMGFLGLFTTALFSQVHPQDIPVLKEYSGEYTEKIRLPIGGLGTGTVSLTGTGELTDWSIMNQPGIGFSGSTEYYPIFFSPFFAIFTDDGTTKLSRGLMGPISPNQYEDMEGTPVPNSGVPRFRNSTFKTTYPFGVVELEDEDMPVSVTVKAFNPLVLGDADKSGIPVAVMEYFIKNTSDKPLKISVASFFTNFVGMDGTQRKRDWNGAYIPTGTKNNRNRYYEKGGVKGIYMDSICPPLKAETTGNIALSVDADQKITYRTAASNGWWGEAFLEMWDDFSADGGFTEVNTKNNPLAPCALSVEEELQPGEEKSVRFFISWHFPNRKSWNPGMLNRTIGNYYAKQYKDSKDVAVKVAPQIDALEQETLAFVKSFTENDIPKPILEAALFNASTLRTQTCFRTPNGYFYGWEGIFASIGSCIGNCNHVWNYEFTLPYLFGDLAKGMRELELVHGMEKSGSIHFRLGVPLSQTKKLPWSIGAATDGQMGVILRAYREWQNSGDTEFSRKLYPKAKRAMEYAWEESGWDPNRDGIMEGMQHNTMDVNYYGPNPEIGFLYLAALQTLVNWATENGDMAFANECKRVLDSGSAFMVENLFNGEYFEQIVLPPDVSTNFKNRGVSVLDYKNKSFEHPLYQVGNGSLVHQLFGQNYSHLFNQGNLVDQEIIDTTLASILKYNYKENFYGHFNNLRSYTFGDEEGLIIAAYPREGGEKVPFPYAKEVWPGLEYTFASNLLYAGLEEEAIKVITDVRDRFDGKRRSPFNETECGNHYVRSMAAWSTLLAYTGFYYSAPKMEMQFNAKEGTFFWSNGYSFGNVALQKADDGTTWNAELSVIQGEITLAKMGLRNGFSSVVKAGEVPRKIVAGEAFTFELTQK